MLTLAMESMSRQELERLCQSDDAGVRLLALGQMRKEIEAGASPVEYIELAHPLIDDPNDDCRWQALIIVGESIQTQPEVVWKVVSRYGVSEDEDMRNGVATVLLEHMLEYHFDWTLKRVRNEIARGAYLMADTLSRCWPFGQAKARWNEVEQLMQNGN